MILSVMAWIVLGLAALPLFMTFWNFLYYRAPARAAPRRPDALVSVLIPARNEASTIEDAVESALASRGVNLEVLVLDDQSQDETPQIVRELAERDPRVRLIHGRPLPAGVCGKPHACAQLAKSARGQILLFMDADVRLSTDAAARLSAHLEASDASFLSGVPRQVTDTIGEQLIIPLIHFMLLGYLPMAAMRHRMHPGFGAACGQLIIVERAAYESAGGHRAIDRSLHDGLSLPRAFRRAGFRTDLVDATELATCRMYCCWREVWQGFAKNAHEGLGSPKGLIPWSVILIGGHVAPLLMLPWALGDLGVVVALSGALLCSYGARTLMAAAFRHTWLSVLLHPIAVALLVAIQWYAALRRLVGQPVTWKGRVPA